MSAGPASATSSTAAVKPIDALVSVSDVSAGTTRAVKAAAWTKALRAGHAAAAAGVLTVADTTTLTAISRAVVAPNLKLAKRYERAAAALAPSAMDGLDAAALAAPAASLAGATRATWRDGVVVGQVTLLDPAARVGPAGATSLAAAVRARVQALGRMPAWDALTATAAERSKPPDAHIALQAFALAFGPVPGVKTPSGPPGDVSSTLALEWVGQNAAHLTKAQKAAVRRALPRATSGKARAAAAGPSAEQQSEDQRTADRALAFLSPKLGFSGRIPRDIVRYAPAPKDGNEATTVAPREDMPAIVARLIGAAGSDKDCTLFLYSSIGKIAGGQELTGENRRYVIAHEVFHCLMQHGLGWVRNYLAPPWVGEGGATFAGCEFAPGATYSQGPHGHYMNWVSSHDWPIPQQNYSGIGLLTLMQSQGADVLKHLADAFTVGWGNPGATFDAAAGNARQAVLDNWASTFLTDDAARTEPGWGTGSTGCVHAPVPSLVLKPTPKKIDVDQAVTVVKEPWTNDVYQLTGSASVIHVQTTRGDVRINGGARTDDKNVTDAYYCVREGGCQCGPSTAKDLSPKTRAPLAAVTGGDRGAYVTFTGVPEVCPVITNAKFSVPSATFTASDQFQSWAANLYWDVGWDKTSSSPTLPLVVGNYQVATRGTMSGGGTFSRTGTFPPSCNGDLTLVGPDSTSDALIRVVGDTGPGPNRAWRIELWATSYDIFNSASACIAPPFGNTDDSFNSHLFMTTITLPATDSLTPHTVTMNVASDPSHAAHESWSGTATLTGIF